VTGGGKTLLRPPCPGRLRRASWWGTRIYSVAQASRRHLSPVPKPARHEGARASELETWKTSARKFTNAGVQTAQGRTPTSKLRNRRDTQDCPRHPPAPSVVLRVTRSGGRQRPLVSPLRAHRGSVHSDPNSAWQGACTLTVGPGMTGPGCALESRATDNTRHAGSIHRRQPGQHRAVPRDWQRCL